MIDQFKLKKFIAKRGVSLSEFAGMIGHSRSKFDKKMAKGIFGADDVTLMVKVLDLSTEEAKAVFFPNGNF